MQKSSTVSYKKKPHFNWSAARPILINLHWSIVIVVSLIFVQLETDEHLSISSNNKSLYYGEVILVILLLFIAGLLTRVLWNSLEDKTRAMHTLKEKHSLGIQLSIPQDMNEMASRMVQFVHSAIPAAGVKLYIYNPVQNQLNLGADLRGDEQIQGKEQASFGTEACQACIAKNMDSLRSLSSCKLAGCSQKRVGSEGYCLPLVRSTCPVGLLHLYLPSDQDIPSEQIELLENVSAEMSGALGMAIEKKAREESTLTQTIYAIQLDIARDLHDTIGQNICYLRLKLGHLAETNPAMEADTQTEIQRMYEVANESYDLVRGTLAMLQSGESTNLIHLLAGHGSMIAERSDFQIDFTSQGDPQSLPPRLMRQLFYIFREALHNIEKHAGASQVWVEINWAEAALILTINDNGCGFDPADGAVGNHYGLKFMRDRIEKLNGNLTIRSRSGAGTNIVIRLPYVQV